MKAYKLTTEQKQYHNTYKTGRIFVPNDGEAICLATFTEETIWCGNYLFNKLVESNLFEEIELENEKWIQPHICKEVRKKMEIN